MRAATGIPIRLLGSEAQPIDNSAILRVWTGRIVEGLQFALHRGQ